MATKSKMKEKSKEVPPLIEKGDMKKEAPIHVLHVQQEKALPQPMLNGKQLRCKIEKNASRR